MQHEHLVIDAHRLHRRDRLDIIFEKLLQTYRQVFLDAIAREPAGPTRYLRSHINSLSDVVCARTRAVAFATKLLQHERYQRVWRDFVSEACANDPEDYDLASINRYTADPQYLLMVQRYCVPRHKSAVDVGTIGIDEIQGKLLSLLQLSQASQSAESSQQLSVTHESHCAR